MKIPLITMILLSALYLGVAVKKKLRQREKAIEKCILLFEAIETQVSFSMNDIQKILKELSKRLNLNFLYDFASDNSDLSVDVKWRNSLNKSSEKDCLKKEDVDVLLSFSALLGVTDADGQINNCRMHKELMNNLLLGAREDNKRKGNLIPTLSILCALTLSVLIM